MSGLSGERLAYVASGSLVGMTCIALLHWVAPRAWEMSLPESIAFGLLFGVQTTWLSFAAARAARTLYRTMSSVVLVADPHACDQAKKAPGRQGQGVDAGDARSCFHPKEGAGAEEKRIANKLVHDGKAASRREHGQAGDLN